MAVPIWLDCRDCGADKSVACEVDGGSCVGVWPCTNCKAPVDEHEAAYAADAEHDAEEERAYLRGGYAR